MKVGVIGCGRWGTLLAWYLHSIGHSVTLYGREGSKNMQRLLNERRNDLLTLDESIVLTTSIESVCEAEVILISIASQSLRRLMSELQLLSLRHKTVVLCMKGLEVGSGERLSVIAKGVLDSTCRVAVWLGPGHVQEFYAGHPSCMVIDSEWEETTKWLADAFSGDLIRFYYGTDLIGNEIGAAAKNVIGIAAGILDGLGLETLKGALMSRGAAEIARLIGAMGGHEASAYGLCHLGDYEATVFSRHSHNRRFGEAFIKGEACEGLAEGCETVRALMTLSRRYQVELPICEAVYRIIHEKADATQELGALFGRERKREALYERHI